MRLGYITADFGVPVLGTKGASAHVRGLVTALRREGHEVAVLAANVGDDSSSAAFPVAELPFGASLLELYAALKQEHLCQDTRLAFDLRNLLYSLSLELQGRVLLDEFRPELIYERYCLFSTAGLELARHYDVPLILEVNAPLVLEQQKMRGLSLPRVARAAERLLFTTADHVIVVSDWLRDYVVEQGVAPARVTVMPNGTDPDLFAATGRRADVRTRFGWTDRDVVFGFVGSMKPWHGVDTIVHALARLRRASPEIPTRLLLVGDGPEMPRIREAIAGADLHEHAHLTGAVRHELVPELIDAMDVVIASYAPEAEGYFSPVKLFEYMAMRRPVVAARTAPTSAVIEHGVNAWLYTPGDVEELAIGLQALAADPFLRTSLADQARDRVLGSFTWPHNARQVAEIGRAAIARRHRSAPRQSDVA